MDPPILETPFMQSTKRRPKRVADQSKKRPRPESGRLHGPSSELQINAPFKPLSGLPASAAAYTRQYDLTWTPNAAPPTSPYDIDFDQQWTTNVEPNRDHAEHTYHGHGGHGLTRNSKLTAYPAYSRSTLPNTSQSGLLSQPACAWSTSPAPYQCSSSWSTSCAAVDYQLWSVPAHVPRTPWPSADYSSQSAMTSPGISRTSYSSTPHDSDSWNSFQQQPEDSFLHPDPSQAAQVLATMSATNMASSNTALDASCCSVPYWCDPHLEGSAFFCAQPCGDVSCLEYCPEDCPSKCASPCLSPCLPPCLDPAICDDHCEDVVCEDEKCLKEASPFCCLYIDPQETMLNCSASHLRKSSVVPLPASSQASCKWIVDESSDKLCGECFGDPNDLQDHIEEVHIQLMQRGATLACSWDGCTRQKRSFDQKLKLKRHVKSHTGYRGAICHLCQQKFADAHTLEAHMRSHTGERPFQCKICHECFAHKSVLKTHERNHVGAKPFKCDFPGCDFATADSSNLSKHKKTHKEGTYPCPVCGKVFKKPSNIKRHLETHRKGKAPAHASSIDPTLPATNAIPS